MSYFTFIFMGFITMLTKFAPDRYMNHVSTSMTVVTCIDAYSHHKTDECRLTLIKKNMKITQGHSIQIKRYFDFIWGIGTYGIV